MIRKLIIDNCALYSENIFYKNEEESITYGDLLKEAKKIINVIPKKYDGPIIIKGKKERNVLISMISCILNGNAYVSVNDTMPDDRIKKIIFESRAQYIIDCTKKNIFLDRVLTNEQHIYYKKYAYVIFTSGSTGNPKGVGITNENLENFIKWINKTIPKKGIKNVFNQANFSFDLSVADLYYVLSNGLLLYGFDGDFLTVVDKIKKNNINLMVVTPTFIKICLLNKQFNEENLPKLKCIFFCGERLEKNTVVSLKGRFKNLSIINAYGPTEATCAVSANEINEKELDFDILPVGKVKSGAVNIEIVNDEIILKGASVFDGYLNYDNKSCFKENGINCYKTGDLGYIKDGYLFCLGRIDNQIKYKGYRIEIEEIEEALLNIEGVDDCIVSTKEKNGVVVSINALIKLKNSININDIKNKLKLRLPSYMIPKKMKIVDEIPYNSNCKKNRRVFDEF